MSTTTYAEETELLSRAFAKARQNFYDDDEPCKIAPFRHVEIPEGVPMSWQPYTSLLGDYLEYLANEINGLGYHIGQLKAWVAVLPEFEIQDQMLLLMEFVDSIAYATLSAPYAIRSRLLFCSTKLNHEAASMTGKLSAEDPLPLDEKIDYKVMLRAGKPWSEFETFKLLMDDLSSESHVTETFNFRHKYNHRVPPRLELGQPWRVTRTKDEATGQTVYSFGHSNPLELASIVPSLQDRHKATLAAFEALSSLSREHVRSIGGAPAA